MIASYVDITYSLADGQLSMYALNEKIESFTLTCGSDIMTLSQYVGRAWYPVYRYLSPSITCQEFLQKLDSTSWPSPYMATTYQNVNLAVIYDPKEDMVRALEWEEADTTLHRIGLCEYSYVPEVATSVFSLECTDRQRDRLEPLLHMSFSSLNTLLLGLTQPTSVYDLQ